MCGESSEVQDRIFEDLLVWYQYVGKKLEKGEQKVSLPSFIDEALAKTLADY